MRLEIDGIPFLLKSPQAFPWLAAYGKVFKVYDRLTSGNLCFCVDGPYGRLFIKYAGAETVNYDGRIFDAVKTLRNAMPLYEKPRDNLTTLLAHGETGEGYAAIFRYLPYESLKITNSNYDVRARLHREPLFIRLRMLDALFELFAQLSEDGLMSVDMSEANILVNFALGSAALCDIDLFRPFPSTNNLGRMPGSPLMLAPEEYIPDALLDRDTDVYHLGALAFLFFSERTDRAQCGWEATNGLYKVALRAVSDERGRRYATPAKFLKAWRAAVGGIRIR